MEDIFKQVAGYLTPEKISALLRAGVSLFVGLVAAKILSAAIAKVVGKKVTAQQLMLARRTTYYLILGIFVVSALKELGFQIGVLLGAAGVMSVAIGFAAQTSASNLISGIFLLLEKPFEVGDVISVGGTTGVVHSIELVSVMIRKFDNTLMRIPNETMVKSDILNITAFPIRRVDLEIGIAYKDDIEKVRDILMEVADKNPLCLEEPAPLFIHTGYGSSSLNMLFTVWTMKENWLNVRNSMYIDIKNAFDEKGVEIPFPHVSIYTGSVTEPFPVSISQPPQDNSKS